MPTFTSPNTARRGFTLTELIVVVVVLGIFALLASVSYDQVKQSAAETTAETTAEAAWRAAQALAAFGDGMTLNGVVVPDVELGGVIVDVILEEVVNTITPTAPPGGGSVTVTIDLGAVDIADALVLVAVVTSSGDTATVTFDGANIRTATFVAGGAPTTTTIPPVATGVVWGTGTNATWGSLGVGNFTTSYSTFQDSSFSGGSKVTAGNHSSLLVKPDGTLWVAGYSYHGRLGVGSAGSAYSTFTQVPGLSGITEASIARDHTLALDSAGNVWAVGNGASGERGVGFVGYSIVFAQVPGVSSVTAVSAGMDFSAVLKSDGSVWTTGTNWNGCLGLGDTASRGTFTDTGLTGVTAISAGYGHLLALKADGTVWATGANGYGALGVGDTAQRTSFTNTGLTGVVAIAAGDDHSAVIKSDGTLWVAGRNYAGALGLGDLTQRTSFTQVPAMTNVAQVTTGVGFAMVRKTDGTLWATGQGWYGNLGNGQTGAPAKRLSFEQIGGFTNVVDIEAGSEHMLILRTP